MLRRRAPQAGRSGDTSPTRHAPTALLVLGYLGAKRGNAKKGSSVVVGGRGWDGLVTLFAQNQRLFPVGEDLAEVIRIARLQVEAAMGAKGAR